LYTEYDQKAIIGSNINEELGFDPETIGSLIRSKKRKFNHKISYGSRGFSGASISNVKTILTNTQLKQCANEWINNGIIRQCINKLVHHLLGQRTKFLVEPNAELVEFIEREKLAQTVTAILGEAANKVPELQQRLIRVNKRCELHSNLQKLTKNSLIFGRNFLGIERFSKADSNGWEKFGEPRALKPMNSLRILDTQVNEDTYAFEGYFYDYGVENKRRELVKSIDMIPLWNDDDNVLDMTNYSGTSLVWTALSAAQAIDVMNDEDVPEYVKGLYQKIGECFVGTNSKAVVQAVIKELEDSNFLIHGRKDLRMTALELGGSLADIMNGREASAKYIAWAMAIPLFIIFEDTANFATANKALQAFKVGTLDRMRTWIQNALEKYWYDPMLADHLNIDLEQVLAARIKVKAVIEDIVFDLPEEIANKEVALVQAGIHTVEQALENMGEDKFLQERKIREAERLAAREEGINEARDIVSKFESEQESADQQQQQEDESQQSSTSD
jgi:hypothetical protein